MIGYDFIFYNYYSFSIKYDFFKKDFIYGKGENKKKK